MKKAWKVLKNIGLAIGLPIALVLLLAVVALVGVLIYLVVGGLLSIAHVEDYTAFAYSDCSVLTAYKGSQTAIVLPAEVEGRPVKHLVNFTDETGMVEEITLPDSLEMLFFNALNAVPALQRFQVSDTHPVFKTVDGVLYTRDGKTLVAYPQGRTGVAVIPEGVETIRVSAFANSVASEVVLPSSLRTIEDGGLSNFTALRVLEIPAGVEVIGKDAFMSFLENKTTLRLIVTEGSPAHAFALEHGLPIERVLPAEEETPEALSPAA